MLQANFVLSAGDLDRIVHFQVLADTREGTYNASDDDWVEETDPTWAKVQESSTAPSTNPDATELIAAYARPMKVWVRWRDDFDQARMRLNFEGRILRITGSAELGRGQWLELACREWAHEAAAS